MCYKVFHSKNFFLFFYIFYFTFIIMIISSNKKKIYFRQITLKLFMTSKKQSLCPLLWRTWGAALLLSYLFRRWLRLPPLTKTSFFLRQHHPANAKCLAGVFYSDTIVWVMDSQAGDDRENGRHLPLSRHEMSASGRRQQTFTHYNAEGNYKWLLQCTRLYSLLWFFRENQFQWKGPSDSNLNLVRLNRCGLATGDMLT